jgi:hypothetical protein
MPKCGVGWQRVRSAFLFVSSASLAHILSFVIAGLDPAIHESGHADKPQGSAVRDGFMDARVKPGHDAAVRGFR